MEAKKLIEKGDLLYRLNDNGKYNKYYVSRELGECDKDIDYYELTSVDGNSSIVEHKNNLINYIYTKHIPCMENKITLRQLLAYGSDLKVGFDSSYPESRGWNIEITYIKFVDYVSEEISLGNDMTIGFNEVNKLTPILRHMDELFEEVDGITPIQVLMDMGIVKCGYNYRYYDEIKRNILSGKSHLFSYIYNINGISMTKCVEFLNEWKFNYNNFDYIDYSILNDGPYDNLFKKLYALCKPYYDVSRVNNDGVFNVLDELSSLYKEVNITCGVAKSYESYIINYLSKDIDSVLSGNKMIREIFFILKDKFK